MRIGLTSLDKNSLALYCSLFLHVEIIIYKDFVLLFFFFFSFTKLVLESFHDFVCSAFLNSDGYGLCLSMLLKLLATLYLAVFLLGY